MFARHRVAKKARKSVIRDCQRLNEAEKYKDIPGIILLIGLYVLQGIPLGLASAAPLLLQSDKHIANYRYQAIFSSVFWPFSIKLAWAPFVDALYIPHLGRRKSWLLPIQYALGIDLFVLGGRVDKWLGRPDGESWGPLGVSSEVQIWPLTLAFFGLTMLAATQDIVVDGWALTMLSAENVGWASTCNSVGQTIGYIVGFIVFLTLESPDVCNTYFRTVPIPGKGIVSFSGFLYFCGIVFIVSTTLLALFKEEKKTLPEVKIDKNGDGYVFDESKSPLLRNGNGKLEIMTASSSTSIEPSNCLSIWQTYCTMLEIMRLRPVLRYIVTVFIVKFVFSAVDSLFGLKLLEHGVSKERMALIASAVLPLQAILPICVTYWSNGPRPLGVFLNAAIPRALVSLSAVVIVYYVDYFRVPSIEMVTELNSGTDNTSFSSLFYVLLVSQLAVYAVFSHTMFVCQMAFHARVADPSIGGTYMTLLNTVTNLASTLPSTVMLFLVDPLTWRSCDNASLKDAMEIILTANNHTKSPGNVVSLAEELLSSNASCKGPIGVETCRMVGGTCRTILDGFYIEVGVCLLIGLVAYLTVLRRMVSTLDALPLLAYRFRRKARDFG